MDKKVNKNKSNSSKKKLVRTHREINRIRIIVTVALLVIAALVYYFVDTSSYVATVGKYRISKAEYKFFLEQQLTATEAEEELTTKEEKEKFWTTPADGQDPYETAKREALNYSKEFMIQYIKAQEFGLKIDNAIKNQVSSLIASIKGDLTEKQFEQQYKIKSKDLQAIYEKFSLIENYKNQYLVKEFKAPEFTENEVKTTYEENRQAYDKVDLSYITFYKFNNTGATLTEEEIAEKMKTAEEAYEKILGGEDMEKVIAKYTEETVAETSNGSEKTVGKATIAYSQDSMYQYYMDWDLIQWAFDNKAGDTKVIDTNYFIYVARIDGRTSFEDAKEVVKNTMSSMAGEEFYNKAIDDWGLESQYNIIKNDRVYDFIHYNES